MNQLARAMGSARALGLVLALASSVSYSQKLTATQNNATPARTNISKFGVVGLGDGERLRLKAQGARNSACVAQLGFEDLEARLLARPLGVNAASGLSLFYDYVQSPASTGRIAVRPMAWVSGAGTSEGCILSLSVLDAEAKLIRNITPAQTCSTDCVPASSQQLTGKTLRLYVAAPADGLCHSQLGFREADGTVGAATKTVALRPGKAEELDWTPSDQAIPGTGDVVPIVAFYPGDICIASAEIFVTRDGPGSVSSVPVQLYSSKVMEVARNPQEASARLKDLEEELSKNPRDRWVLIALAKTYAGQNLNYRAIDLLEQALTINAKMPETWLQLASVYKDVRKFDSALAALDKCLELDPGNVSAKLAYADTLLAVDRLDEAQKIFAALFNEQQRKSAALLRGYAEFLLAKKGNQEALQYIQQAEFANPTCPATLFTKARILKSLNRLPEATAAAERVVALQPALSANRLLLARLYREQGKTDQAADQFRLARANLTQADRQ